MTRYRCGKCDGGNFPKHALRCSTITGVSYPTKQECLEEIAILTRQLLRLKWYQFKQKQYTKGELRIWMRDYDNLLRAE